MRTRRGRLVTAGVRVRLGLLLGRDPADPARVTQRDGADQLQRMRAESEGRPIIGRFRAALMNTWWLVSAARVRTAPAVTKVSVCRRFSVATSPRRECLVTRKSCDREDDNE